MERESRLVWQLLFSKRNRVIICNLATTIITCARHICLQLMHACSIVYQRDGKKYEMVDHILVTMKAVAPCALNKY